MLSGAVFTGLKPGVNEIAVKNPCQDGFRTNAHGLVVSSLIFLQPDKHTVRAPPVTDSGWQGQAQLQVIWSKTNKTLAAIEKDGSKFREVLDCGGCDTAFASAARKPAAGNDLSPTQSGVARRLPLHSQTLARHPANPGQFCRL